MREATVHVPVQPASRPKRREGTNCERGGSERQSTRERGQGERGGRAGEGGGGEAVVVDGWRDEGRTSEVD